MPPITPHAIAVLALVLLALFLFSRESIPIETSALIILVTLCVGFTIFPNEAHPVEADQFLLGFGNEALIAIASLMVASEALARTGALAPLGRWLARHWTQSPMLFFLLMLLFTALISALMNNTPQVVLMIPILISVSLRSGMAASDTLMPMTFAAQLGGMATPIGTSLNLLVISSAASLGVQKFGMFDFAAPAAIAGVIGVLYLWLLAPRLLPERQPQIQDTSPRIFSAQLSIVEESNVVGKKLADAIAASGGTLKIQRIMREDVAVTPLPDLMLNAGDRLFVRETPTRLKEVELAWKAHLYEGENKVTEETPLKDKDQQLAEIVITPTSPLEGTYLENSRLEEQHDLLVLAHHRAEEHTDIRKGMQHIRLEVGDVLLVQGHAERIQELKKDGDMLLLDATTQLPHTRKAPLALAIMGCIVLVSTLKILPVAYSAMLGVLIMLLSGCLTWRDALRALDSKMILLTTAAIALSYAMVQTDGALWLAQGFVQLVQGYSGPVIVSGMILFMALLANIVSNSAAAVLGTPIAVKIAMGLGYSPEAFVLAVLFGVNMSYATPTADNCNLLVYSAGNYKFTDFMRAGIPLTLLMWASYSVLLPIFFPLSR